MLDLVLETRQAARRPLGWEALSPVISLGLLVLKLLPSVFATGIWGLGCHANGVVVGLCVGSRDVRSMYSTF